MQMHVFVITKRGRYIHLQVFLTCVESNGKLKKTRMQALTKNALTGTRRIDHAAAFIAVTT